MLFCCSFTTQKINGELKSDCKFQFIDNLPPKMVEEEKGVPTNLASFKIDLQDNEKKAKEELVLPYMLYVNFFLKMLIG